MHMAVQTIAECALHASGEYLNMAIVFNTLQRRDVAEHRSSTGTLHMCAKLCSLEESHPTPLQPGSFKCNQRATDCSTCNDLLVQAVPKRFRGRDCMLAEFVEEKCAEKRQVEENTEATRGISLDPSQMASE